MFSDLLYQLSGLGFKKGTFWHVFRPWEPHLGILVEQLLVSEGPSLPSLLSPLSHLNLLFGWSCWDPPEISHEVVRTTTPETISIFLLIQLDCIGKTGWYSQLADLAPPIPLKVSGSSSEDSASSSPSGFTLKSSSAPMLSTTVDGAVNVWLPFSFLEGNKFPVVCGWVTFDPPVMVVFRSRGSLASDHLSNFWAAKEQVRVTSRVFHHPLCWANMC